MAKARIRIHRKSSKALNDFLSRNKKKYSVEKTATGFPTYIYKEKDFYIREKRMNSGALNKIMEFHNQVAESELYQFVSTLKTDDIEKQTAEINKTLMYKGFFFDPMAEKEIKNVIKIDLNTAYWQTCRIVPVINKKLYKYVVDNCTKPTRLKLTGTLGQKRFRTDHENGIKKPTYLIKERKRRVIFRNVYNRIRKFVDELMVWAWMRNPSNFIGFYVDCLWIREPDFELLEKIQEMFDIKISNSDLKFKINTHRKYIMLDENLDDGELTTMDVRFKNKEFINYRFFHEFGQDFGKINFLTKEFKDLPEKTPAAR